MSALLFQVELLRFTAERYLVVNHINSCIAKDEDYIVRYFAKFIKDTSILNLALLESNLKYICI